MSDGSPTCQLVIFAIESEEYALPIEQVQEIIRYAEPRTVASQDASVKGVIALRGRIVPVLSLALRLGRPEQDRADESKIVIAELDGEVAGLVVDEVHEVRTIDRGQIDESPASIAGAGLAGVVQIEERLIALLDASELLGGMTLAGTGEEPARLHAVA